MLKRIIIKVSIPLVVIVAIGAVTVITMRLLSVPQKNVVPENSHQGNKDIAADNLYRQTEAAFKAGDSTKAKDLFQKAKESYLKDPSEEALEKLANTESYLQTINLKEKGPPIVDSTKLPLVKSGQ